MKVWKASTAARAAVVATVATTVVTLGAGPALAAHNDEFWVYTTNGAGYAHYIDYGYFKNYGNDDDYIRIYDFEVDSHGVKAYAWLNGAYLGSMYNGLGDNEYVDWDPFPAGNVAPGDSVGLKVCLVDGNSDPTPFDCQSATQTSVDG